MVIFTLDEIYAFNVLQCQRKCQELFVRNHGYYYLSIIKLGDFIELLLDCINVLEFLSESFI